MFTPTRLLEIAIAAEQAHENGDDVWKSRQTAREALACASWMEDRGIETLNSVGPFVDRAPQRGERVRIKEGAEIHSTSKRLCRTNRRTYSVVVHDTHKGYIEPDGKIRQPTLHWVGTNGYWCWTDLQNVELGH